MKIAIGCMGELGSMILECLSKRKKIQIVGVDTMTDREGQIDCAKTIKKLGLPRKNYKEIVLAEPDIFISISYLKKVGKELLEKCLCVNLHVAKLPEYKGRSVYTHAILNGEKEYYTTLHLMAEEIDAGDIIAEWSSRIKDNDTAKTLYDRMQKVSFGMFKSELPKLLKGTFKTKKQAGVSHFYTKELDKEINMFKMKNKDIYDKIRALDFPPYEPAFYWHYGKKVHLRLEDIRYHRKKDELILCK